MKTISTTTPAPEEAASKPSSNGRNGGSRRVVKRTLLFIAMVFIVYYLVLPQLARGRESADLLSSVNPILLVLAVLLEGVALWAYTILTKVTLPREPKLTTFSIFRIQMATKAVTNVMPGGSAAGGTLGYKLFTDAGVAPTAAGFTLATVGLGSAVVLNLILWVALVISIPINGLQPLYVTSAIVGVLLLLSCAALVWLLMEGRDRAEKILRAIARRIPFVQEDTASRFIHQLADRLHDLAQQPELVRRGVLWAIAHWLFDAAALFVFLLAFNHFINPINLVVAFGVASVLAAIPVTPGGLGLVEAALPAMLVSFGVPLGVATISVLAWRFVQFWFPIPLGAVSFVSLQFGSLGRRKRLRSVRELAHEATLTATRRVWDDETGEYRTIRTTQAEAERIDKRAESDRRRLTTPLDDSDDEVGGGAPPVPPAPI